MWAFWVFLRLYTKYTPDCYFVCLPINTIIMCYTQSTRLSNNKICNAETCGKLYICNGALQIHLKQIKWLALHRMHSVSEFRWRQYLAPIKNPSHTSLYEWKRQKKKQHNTQTHTICWSRLFFVDRVKCSWTKRKKNPTTKKCVWEMVRERKENENNWAERLNRWRQKFCIWSVLCRANYFGIVGLGHCCWLHTHRI